MPPSHDKSLEAPACETVHFFLDGESVEARAGQTLKEALGSRLKLPCLYGERLQGLSYPCPGCGLSVVELPDLGRTVLACSTMASEGLTVSSFSPMVRRAKQLALKELVKRHPGQCLVCERSGQCGLQKACADLGLALASRPNPDPALTLVSPLASPAIPGLPPGDLAPAAKVRLVGWRN